MMESYLSSSELRKLNFKKIGEDVKISKRAVFYSIENIEIGSHVRIDDFAFLSGGVRIGDYVHIAPYSALYGKFGIEVGDYVNISSRVTIYSNSDDYSGEFMAGPMVEARYINEIGKKVIIEDHVIIGTGSVLLPGAVLRKGVAVGSMSLVKMELQQFKMYAGIPARYIKERSKAMLEKEQQMKNTDTTGGIAP